ncbi:MAG: hypothetical protein IH631_00615, partial [Candidatus Thorarchaeota archaeon]|nr:hypothetical protein [Candidatus Thorarchaeota archaeon]
AEEVAQLSGSKPSEEPREKVETIDEEEQVSEPEPEAAEEIEEPVEDVSEPEASTDDEIESDDIPETEEVNE